MRRPARNRHLRHLRGARPGRVAIRFEAHQHGGDLVFTGAEPGLGGFWQRRCAGNNELVELVSFAARSRLGSTIDAPSRHTVIFENECTTRTASSRRGEAQMVGDRIAEASPA